MICSCRRRRRSLGFLAVLAIVILATMCISQHGKNLATPSKQRASPRERKIFQDFWEGLSETQLLQHGLLVTNTPPLQYFIDDQLFPGTINVSNPSYSGRMTYSEIEGRFHQLCHSTHVKCTAERRLGNEDDGGWNVCVAGVYWPKPGGLVYSFGINFDFSFDDAMALEFQSVVHSFDPSMHVGRHRRHSGVYFHDVGLAGEDEVRQRGWKMLSLASIMKRLGHEQAILEMLKFDIELGELEALQQMLPTGILRNVKQLAFEFHFFELEKMGPSILRDTYLLFLELERQGFRKYRMHLNPVGKHMNPRSGNIFAGCCYELYYINLHFLVNK